MDDLKFITENNLFYLKLYFLLFLMSNECSELLFSLKGQQLLTFIKFLNNIGWYDNSGNYFKYVGDYYDSYIEELYIHMIRTNSNDLRIFIEDCPEYFNLQTLFYNSLYIKYIIRVTDIMSDIKYRIKHNIPSLELFNDVFKHCLDECENEEYRCSMLNFCKYFMQFGAYNNGLNALEIYEYIDEWDYIKDHLKNKLYI